jgi:general stress protein YciG
MAGEGKMSREEAGKSGGKHTAGKTRHFTRESKERLIEGARKGGAAEKHISPEARERMREGGRKGGERSHSND